MKNMIVVFAMLSFVNFSFSQSFNPTIDVDSEIKIQFFNGVDEASESVKIENFVLGSQYDAYIDLWNGVDNIGLSAENKLGLIDNNTFEIEITSDTLTSFSIVVDDTIILSDVYFRIFKDHTKQPLSQEGNFQDIDNDKDEKNLDFSWDSDFNLDSSYVAMITNPIHSGNHEYIYFYVKFVDGTPDQSLSIIENTNIDFRVYPNPVVDVLTIDFESNGVPVSIYSMNGSIMYQSNDFGKVMVDVSTYQSGVYFVKVGETVKKFIKQ